jgi:ferric-dicitrate binding protein FerR (iron transport regulator)
MKEEIWDIIAKKLSKEKLNNEEEEQLELLTKNEETEKIISESELVMEKTELLLNLKKYDTEKAWNKISPEINQKKVFKLNKLNWLYAAAAIGFILIVTSIATMRFMPGEKVSFSEVITTDTDITDKEVILPDGTKVILNHGSKLVYPEKFTKETREINLSGEAFFDVKPNPEKPFIINTGKASVKVLGTSFNVFAYNNSPTVEVVVKTGKVELSENNKKDKADKKILLTPGQKGTFNKTTGNLLKENSFNPNELSWFTHEIKFEYTSLEDVLKTMKRVYNINFDVDEDVNMSNQLNASFNKQDIDHVLNVVSMTLDLSVEKVGENKYIIHNK